MRHDTRGPPSTNSAYGQFYDRPSVAAAGARDSARSGVDAFDPDRQTSAGRRLAHAHAAEREAPARPASLDRIPAAVVKATDAGRPVGAFTGAVGRTDGRRARSGSFDDALSSPVSAALGRPFARAGVARVGPASASGAVPSETPLRALRALRGDAASPASRKPEWNASFAAGAFADETRRSRVGADALLSARAAEERGRFEDSRVDRVGRRVASLRGAVEKKGTAVEDAFEARETVRRDDPRIGNASASASASASFENLRVSGGNALSGASRIPTRPGLAANDRTRSPPRSPAPRSLAARNARSPKAGAVSSAAPRARDAPRGHARDVAGAATVAGSVGGVAKENQDSFFRIPGGEGSPGDFAAGVLDGHGADGRRVSRFVAGKIKASLERYFRSASGASGATGTEKERGKTTDALEDAVSAAFADADAALRAAPRGSIDHEESGCTCVVVVRQGDALLTANVGDSRAVLCSVSPRDETFRKAVARDLSSDHKPDRPDERARIERTRLGCVERARDGFFGFAGPPRVWLSTTPKQGGLAVSRAFGDYRLARAGVTPTPELFLETLDTDDTPKTKETPLCVILASDGVWDHVSSEAAAAAAAAAMGAAGNLTLRSAPGAGAIVRGAGAAADAIAANAVAGWRGAANGGYRDDVTVVVAPLV